MITNFSNSTIRIIITFGSNRDCKKKELFKVFIVIRTYQTFFSYLFVYNSLTNVSTDFLTLFAFSVTSWHKPLRTDTCHCSCWQCICDKAGLWSSTWICHSAWILTSFANTCHLRRTVLINPTLWLWPNGGCCKNNYRFYLTNWI